MAVYIQRRTHRYAAVSVLVAPLILAYLLGMYRTFGVDFDTYEAYLGHERDRVPDIGYKILMELAHAFGLSLSEFFLLQALFTLGAIYVLAKKLRSDFVVTITLYILHAAIVRDFSQSRTALALAIYFVALAQHRRSVYLLLTAMAVSVHLTLVPLVVVYHWSRMVVGVHRGQVFFVVAPAAAVLLGMALLLPMLSALDPRIEIYMNWSQDLYGSPVGSYTTLLLFLLIAAVSYRAYQVTGDEASKVFLIMILYAAVTFIAFRHLAIFAFRLSNVVAALYPFAIGRAIYLLKSRDQNRLFDVAVPLALLGALLLAVIIRPGSLDVLQETQPALLTYGR
jgi:hypothetical protein